MLIWPDILTEKTSKGVTTYSMDYLIQPIKYLLNAVIIIILSLDMRKQNFKSIALLVLTFFSSLTGVIFFLIRSNSQFNNDLTISDYE